MRSTSPHSQQILETGIATVTSAGHWFNVTRDIVEKLVPGLLKRRRYEKLIQDAVVWIESTDSLALILFFVLVFGSNTIVAISATIIFYFSWYFYKASFVNIFLTPILRFVNLDLFQIGMAALALSLLGMNEIYSGLISGVIFFFLFKVGLLRMFLGRLDFLKRFNWQLPLNDQVFMKILLRYSIYENLNPSRPDQFEKYLTIELSKRET